MPRRFGPYFQGSIISVISYQDIKIYTSVYDKQNKHGEPREYQLKGKSINQNNGKGRP